jgi:glycosyltransferase involved in cell wall biosynthesis
MPLMEKKGLVKAILKITENVTYACATCVYPNSTGLFDFMLREFPAHQAKYKVIGRGSSNGIPVDHFTRSVETKRLGIEFRTEHQIPEDSIVFCFIGRLVADKGVKELLSAYSVVERVVKNTRLILVGPFEEELNPLNDELMQEIRKNPNVICTGFLADVRVPLEITTIFVFPSYREGFPNVLLQACLMEVACIASDINGCNEVVVQQETGLLVPPKDSKKLAAAMLLLAQDRELRDRLAKRGRTFAIANYSQAFVWQELLKEYHSVIAQLHG